VTPEAIAEVQSIKADLADLYESLNRQVLESVTEKDLQSASLLQKATTSGIFTNKMRLLRSESTSNINVRLLIDVLQALRDRDEAPEYDSLFAPPEIRH
jgi:hypothetical protein